MLSFYLAGLKKIFGIAKKVLLVITVFFIVISLFMYFINRDRPKLTYDPIKKNREEIYKVINDPKLSKSKEGKLSIALYRTMLCGIIGEGCSNNPNDGDKNFQNSMVGFMTNLIVLPYANPPASGVYWAYSGLQNAGFIPKTYAAEGIGFGALKPFINLWKIFRDLSYMLLVLVLIAIGFMIMFRMKLNPQTVISVESALPKIVLSLLLITFSFPIAGFLIDLMYVIIAIIISILSNNGLYYNVGEYQQKYLNAGFWTILDSLVPNSGIGDIWGLDFAKFMFVDVGTALFSILPVSLRLLIQLITAAGTLWVSHIAIERILHISSLKEIVDNWAAGTFSLGKTPSAVIGTVALIITTVLGAFIGVFWGPLIIIGLLILTTILLLLFRIFFLVFKAYIQIVLLIIFSPLILLFEAVPGRSAFSFWFKNLFAELLTFPIVIAIFILGNVMINQISASNAIWKPPFLYSIENQNAFAMLLGLGMIFIIPELVKLIKELMGIKGLPVGVGLGTFFAGAGVAVGGGLGLVGQYGSLALAMPGLRGFARKITKDIPLIKGLFQEPQPQNP